MNFYDPLYIPDCSSFVWDHLAFGQWDWDGRLSVMVWGMSLAWRSGLFLCIYPNGKRIHASRSNETIVMDGALYLNPQYSLVTEQSFLPRLLRHSPPLSWQCLMIVIGSTWQQQSGKTRLTNSTLIRLMLGRSNCARGAELETTGNWEWQGPSIGTI